MNRRIKTVSRPNSKAFGRVILLIVVFPWLPMNAWAHKLNVFAFVEADKVLVEGYYGGKARAVSCLVEVLNSDGEKLFEGRTDSQGGYSFRLKDLPPVRGQLTIVLHATEGHRAQYKLNISEGNGRSSEKPSYQPQPGLEESRQTLSSQAASMTEHQDAELLKKVVDEAIEAKLQPIIQMLSSQQKLLVEHSDKSPSWTEIFGGLGWIFGLVGVAAYFMSLSKMRKL